MTNVRAKTIVVRRDSLSNIGSSIGFSYDDDFENAIRELIVGKIKDMEKVLFYAHAPRRRATRGHGGLTVLIICWWLRSRRSHRLREASC